VNKVSRKLLWAVLATGCGKVVMQTPDAGSGAGDGAVARCDPTAPFGTPKIVPGVNSSLNFNDEDLYLLADGTTGWFSSNRTGAFAAYQAMVSTTPASVFPAPTLLSDGTQPVERPIGIDSGRTMFGVTQIGGSFFIGVAQRTSTMATFGPLDTAGVMKNVNVTGGNVDTLDVYSSDGNVLYFASDRDASGGIHHLYRSMRSGPTSDFGAATMIMIAGLDSTVSDQSSPVVSADGLTLYFAGTAGNSASVYRATGSGAGDFGNAALLHLDMPTPSVKPSWISTDDCVLYLTTDDGQGGQRKIYFATRGP
jgi:hypothetical protein